MDKSSSYNISGVKVTGKNSAVCTYLNVLRLNWRYFPRSDCKNSDFNDPMWWEHKAVPKEGATKEKVRYVKIANNSKPMDDPEK